MRRTPRACSIFSISRVRSSERLPTSPGPLSPRPLAALCADRSGTLIDRHFVRDPAQGRVLLGRREPAHLQQLRTCGLFTTGLVANMARESARPCTRAAILTV